MSDLDLLRGVLQDRASLAPDPETVFGQVTDCIRRSRTRRRAAAGLFGTAVATVGVLVATGLLNPTSPLGGVSAVAPTSPSMSSVPAPGTSLPRPRLPFSVSAPTGYQVDGWRIGPVESSIQFVGQVVGEDVGQAALQSISVRLRPRDPAAGSNGQATTVHGISAILRHVAPAGWDTELSWQLSPGQWVSVYGVQPAVSEQQLRLVAESVTAAPLEMASSLRVANLPNGLALAGWAGARSEYIGERITLCPPGADPLGAAGQCVALQPQAGTAPDTWVTMSAAGKKAGAERTPLSEPAADGTRLSADGQTVVRQLDPTHWLSVDSTGVDSAVLREVAASASIG